MEKRRIKLFYDNTSDTIRTVLLLVNLFVSYLFVSPGVNYNSLVDLKVNTLMLLLWYLNESDIYMFLHPCKVVTI